MTKMLIRNVMHLLSKVNLRSLILLLAGISAVIGVLNTFYASYHVQKEQLINRTLESNRVYTRKMVNIVEHFLHDLQQQLAYSASLLVDHMDNPDVMQQEASRIHLQENSFNAAFVVSAEGILMAESPLSIGLKGTKLETPGAKAALQSLEPLISEQYVSAANNLIVFVSHPIISADGTFLGYVGGSLYLKAKNVLYRIIGEHYYNDGSYLYVVDQNRRIIYHQFPERIGEQVSNNLAIDRVISGESSAKLITNSLGIEMLAGYAYLPSTGWGVVAQRPLEQTLNDLDNLMLGVLYKTMPLAIVTLIFIWWLASLISQPLWHLARRAMEVDKLSSTDKITNIRSWYFEVAQLKRAILIGQTLMQQKIGRLNQDVLTDPMTGLYNRRGLQRTLERWRETKQTFSVITLDIDHFKRVNDEFGHDVGDQVIKKLAQFMQHISRSSDLLYRTGGEEFLLLLPETPQALAIEVAERLRLYVEQSAIDIVGHITISLGVANWPENAADIDRVFKLADRALYEAKHAGRNKVMAALMDNNEQV